MARRLSYRRIKGKSESPKLYGSSAHIVLRFDSFVSDWLKMEKMESVSLSDDGGDDAALSAPSTELTADIPLEEEPLTDTTTIQTTDGAECDQVPKDVEQTSPAAAEETTCPPPLPEGPSLEQEVVRLET